MLSKYTMTLKHDKGTVKLSIIATSFEQAVKIICRAENCPEQAVHHIKRTVYKI